MWCLENCNDLIVTIVKRGLSEEIINGARKAGAEGATVFYGRGTGIHEKKKLLGIPIEPEKEIIFIVTMRDKSDEVLEAIIEAGDLNKPGHGTSFVLELKKVAGMVHLLGEMQDSGEGD
jgi:nitrogen regulatory protein P-II 1